MRVFTPKCDQCEVLVINNVQCHETGCPNSWLNPMTMTPYKRECRACADEFTPQHSHQKHCYNCRRSMAAR